MIVDYLELPPPASNLRVSIAIPACNEADLLEQTLEAFTNQRAADKSLIPHDSFELLLLVNNSGDASGELARNFAHRHPSLRLHVLELSFVPPHNHVGSARRTAMNLAASRVPANGIIATTDADTIVDSNWVSSIVRVVEQGADVVAGYIDYGDANFTCRNHVLSLSYRMLLCRLENLHDPQLHDPAPRHFQNYGPNLAVTRNAYERAGGVPALSSLEDIGLIDALKSVDARIRHSFEVRVRTSSRVEGRVGFGHSVQLGRWLSDDPGSASLSVLPPDYYVLRYRISAQAAQIWRGQTSIIIDELAQLAGLSQLLCCTALAESTSAGGFVSRIMSAAGEGEGVLANYRPVTVRKAIARAIRILTESPSAAVRNRRPGRDRFRSCRRLSKTGVAEDRHFEGTYIYHPLSDVHSV